MRGFFVFDHFHLLVILIEMLVLPAFRIIIE